MKINVLVALMVVASMMVEPSESAIDCGQVTISLTPCLSYLTQGGNPTPQCCSGVNNVKRMTPTTVDRQAACECVKAAAAHFQNIKPDVASQLPNKCGVQFDFPIKKDVNCKTIP
ncbi:hypothetical protein ACFE04_000911 [Oxalis oulophora]